MSNAETGVRSLAELLEVAVSLCPERFTRDKLTETVVVRLRGGSHPASRTEALLAAVMEAIKERGWKYILLWKGDKATVGIWNAPALFLDFGEAMAEGQDADEVAALLEAFVMALEAEASS